MANELGKKIDFQVKSALLFFQFRKNHGRDAAYERVGESCFAYKCVQREEGVEKSGKTCIHTFRIILNFSWGRGKTGHAIAAEMKEDDKKKPHLLTEKS